jgi:peptide deformylase
MILNIVEYPDKKLKEKSVEVEAFDNNLHELLNSMNNVMLESNGIGLAAIQVGHAKRILILNIPNEENEQPPENLLEIVNPVVVSTEGETTYQEGCLSVPKFYEDINRFEKISIEYQNRFGEKKTLDADGLLSIAIQHEMDHLNGILFIDKLSYSRRKKFEKEYKKMLKERKKGGN